MDTLPALTADTVYTNEIFELIPLVAAEENIDLTVSNGTKSTCWYKRFRKII